MPHRTRPPARELRALGSRRLRRLALLAALLVGCGTGAGDAPAGEGATRPPAVEAVPARFGALPLEERLSGVVRTRDQVAVRPEIEAAVVEVFVRSGEAVERYQPLVRLDDADLADQLRQAEANLRMAEAAASEAAARLAETEARVTRSRALAREELVSHLELETQEAQLAAVEARAAQAEAHVAQANATVGERRSALEKTVVRSPVAGRVGQRRAEVGMIVDSGTTLFEVGSLEELIVEVPLTEALLYQVEEGTPVRLSARVLDAPLPSRISRISPFLEAESFSTTAEIDVENPGRLRPGTFVTVDVLYGESSEATLVPVSAIREDPRSGEPGIWVVTEATGLTEAEAPGGDVPDIVRGVAFRPVVVLAEGRGTAGVRGVDRGEWVVTVGQHLLWDESRGEERRVGTARVRPTSWDRVQALAGLQREDLLAGLLDKQRRIAAVLGAEIPVSETVVEEALAAAGELSGAAPEGPSGPGAGGS